jgi:hypothetical protein
MISLGTIALMTFGMVPVCHGFQTIQQHESAPSQPIPLDGVLNWLKEYGKTRGSYALYEPGFISRIGKVGISFQPTPEVLDKIRSAGGSEKLVNAINAPPKPAETKAPDAVTKVEEPPPVKQGRLMVTCEPVDCNVFVKENLIGTTLSGLLSQDLPEGAITVAATTKDYEADQKPQVAVIKENMPAIVAFTFHPAPAALEAAGASYFKQMIEALGGEEGLLASGFLRGRGTLTSHDRDGKQTVWGISALIKSPDKAKFEVTRNGQTYEVARTERGMEWSKTEKGPEFGELELCLQKLQEHHLAETIGRLKSASFRISTQQLRPVLGEAVVLRAVGGVESYSITLDSDLRPIQIVLESEGLNNGMKVLYLDYIQQEHSFYPKRTEILLPDAPAHGLEVRFDEFALSPTNVKDTDFRLKRKGKFLVFGK